MTAALAPVVAATRPMLPLLVTLAAYDAGLRLQRWLGGAAWANPVLTAVVLIACGLVLLGVPPETYLAGVQPLTLLLGPATIALAVPLYRSLPQMQVNLVPILVTVCAGSSPPLAPPSRSRLCSARRPSLCTRWQRNR